MKRKTNLFYTSGPDSKFITFSNYTESLTGNFLSTDTKIYPSKFLCLNIENLNKDSKELLIKYLVAYYENKLAFLRDKLIEENLNVEEYMLPFNYLLEALAKVKIVSRSYDNIIDEDIFNDFVNIILLLNDKVSFFDNKGYANDDLTQNEILDIIEDKKNYYVNNMTDYLNNIIRKYNNDRAKENLPEINIGGDTYKVEFKEYQQGTDDDVRDILYSLSLVWEHDDIVPNDTPVHVKHSIIDFFNSKENGIFIKSKSNSVIFETDEETDNLISYIIDKLKLTPTENTGYYRLNYNDDLINSTYLWNTKYYLDIKDINDVESNDLNIVYVGDITEFDYNGTYTDTICNIDLFDYTYGEININKSNYNPAYSYAENTYINKLYNWDNDTPSDYDNVKPIADIYSEDENGAKKLIYNYSSVIDKLNINTPKMSEDDEDDKQIFDTVLKFNVLIPLFDVTNINYKRSELGDLVENKYIDLNHITSSSIDEDNIPYCNNVPLGMWFADEPIELKRDKETGYSQSWSLLISSQFKPFPYSSKQVKEYEISKLGNSFNTFSQILNKQNEIINQFEYYNNKIIDIEDKINVILSKINNGTIFEDTVDNLKLERHKFEKSINNQFTEFKDYVISYIKNLTWTSSI